MTNEIWAEWYNEIFLKYCGEARPQILIMDNHHSHESLSLLQAASDNNRGWTGGAMVLGKLPVPGRPTNLDHSRARAYCACSGCGWGLFGHFLSRLSFLFSFSLSLGDGPIETEILSQRAVKPKTTNQPTNQTIKLSHCRFHQTPLIICVALTELSSAFFSEHTTRCARILHQAVSWLWSTK